MERLWQDAVAKEGGIQVEEDTIPVPFGRRLQVSNAPAGHD